MEAVISGKAGLAMLIEGEQTRILYVQDPEEEMVVRPEDFRYYFQGVGDLLFLEDVTRQVAVDSLQSAYKREETRRYMGYLFDPDLQTSTRTDLAQHLETQWEIIPGLEPEFYSRPIPRENLAAAQAICTETGADHVMAFVNNLVALQPSIEKVWWAWEQISPDLFVKKPDEESPELKSQKKSEFEVFAFQAGLFGDMALAVENGKLALFQMTALTKANHYVGPFELWGRKTIIGEWVHGPGLSTTGKVAEQEREERRDEPKKRDPKNRKKRRGKKQPNLSNREKAENVTKQKDAITHAIESGNLDRAEKYLADLRRDQLGWGDDEFFAKTLCHLAMIAKEEGLFQLQKKLTEESIEVNPRDAWAWAQYGDALLRNGHLTEALETYERSMGLGEDVVAMCGRAEVLKAQNKLDQALAAYEEVMASHPNAVVAKTGRAEVLKAQNKLDQALAAYEDVMASHPNDVVAKTGRAEVLKAQNKLDQALEAYEEVMASHPNDVVARNGRAEVLKAQNKLDQALAAYEEVMASHPNDVVARTGRAEVLKAQNKLDQTLEAYEEIRKTFPFNQIASNGLACVLAVRGQTSQAIALLQNLETKKWRTSHEWSGLHILGMLYLKTNQVHMAMDIFQQGLDCPRPIEVDYFRSALALAQLKRGEIAAAIQTVDTLASNDLFSDSIRLQVFATAGETEKAYGLHHQLIQSPVLLMQEIVREIDHRYLSKTGAGYSEAWLIDKQCTLLFATA